jgi:hypothetical protein
LKTTNIFRIGCSRDSDWKVEIECATCPHKVEKDLNKKCQYKFIFELEHEEPGKVYNLTSGYSAQKAFSAYLKVLIDEGLDADQVMTKITRIENPDGPGTVYTFEKGEVLEAEPAGAAAPMTDAEGMAISALQNKIASGHGPIDADMAATVLSSMSTFGITEARAKEIIAMIAVDGMVSA